MDAMRTVFEAAHNKGRFGFVNEGKALVVEAVSVEVVGGGSREAEREVDGAPLPSPPAPRASSPRARGARQWST